MSQSSAHFNQTTWRVEDNRLPRHRRVDQFSVYLGMAQYGCEYLLDSARASMNLNGEGKSKRYDLPIDNPSFSRHHSFSIAKAKGIVIFLHDANSSSWRQWRHVVGAFMDAPEFREYKFWAPDLTYSSSCEFDFFDTVKRVNDTVTEFALDHPDAFVYFIGHSKGARIAAMIETIIDVQTFRTMHVRYVSLSGCFGPAISSKQPRTSMGLSQYLGFPDDFAKTVTEDAAHDAFMTLWNNRQKVWDDLRMDVKHLFCASVDHDLVSQTSFPKLDHAVDYKLVTGWDRYSLVSGILEIYLQWCCDSCRFDRRDEVQVDAWLAECYLAIDKWNHITKDSKEQMACETYQQFLVTNERSIVWSRELLFEHFSQDICIGDLVMKGLYLLPVAETRKHQLLRYQLQQDINRWLRLPIDTASPS